MSTRAGDELELQQVERSVLLFRGRRVPLDETLASLTAWR
jgi:hypothetical protein